MNLEELVIPLKVKDDLSKVMLGITAGVAAFVGVATLAVNATFDWAESMDALGDVTGMSNEELAAWTFTAKKAGVPVDKLTKGMTILEKGLVKADGSLDTIGKKFEEFGINVLDANGQVRNQADLLNEIGAKYNSFGTQQERVNFLTEVFGKSGADLIDVFDTLAADGGINAVTEKVKELGLVIDPAKYEELGRKWEELKLMGTGLAISFTEMLMPAFNGVLDYFKSFQGLSINEIITKLSIDFAMLGANFSAWAESIDWGQVTQDIIDGINSIDWALLGQRIHDGFEGIFNGLKTIVEEVGWSAIFEAAGLAFLNFMAGLTGQGSWEEVKAVWASNQEQLKIYMTGWLERMQQDAERGLTDFILAFMIPFHQLKFLVERVFDDIGQSINDTVSDAVGWIERLSDAIGNIPGITAPNVGSYPGIPRRASGGSASGLTWVGERGAELVNLPNGSHVYSNSDSKKMTQNQPVTILDIDYGRLAKVIGMEFAKVAN